MHVCARARVLSDSNSFYYSVHTDISPHIGLHKEYHRGQGHSKRAYDNHTREGIKIAKGIDTYPQQGKSDDKHQQYPAI